MKNTQRKWHQQCDPCDKGNDWAYRIYSMGVNTKHIASVVALPCEHPGEIGHEAEEEKANARLIASAPDLLNACKHLVSILGDENEDFYNKHIEAFNLGMDAIVSAEDINHG